MKPKYFIIFSLISLIISQSSYSQKLTCCWSFDSIQKGLVTDEASNVIDTIKGNFELVDGVKGKGLKCDGFTTRIIGQADKAPVISGAFSVEAWVAPQAYPWNWCAIVGQQYDQQRGFYFGIDAEGRIGLDAAVNRVWRECTSNEKIPFMKWSYIAATFDPQNGITLYIDGKKSGYLGVKGYLLNDIKMDLEIARNRHKTVPALLNRAGRVRIPASYSYDGIIDELKIFSVALSPGEILSHYKKFQNHGKPELIWRKLPQISGSNHGFGAFYTNLKYDPDWDRLWKVDKYSDVVVTFDSVKYWMAFWRGTNYNMNMVTPDAKWIADQSAEGGGPETQGCAEHMSDKYDRYSHVRIIENNKARVVIHWRYALTDVTYQIANVDPVTGWGDWTDEYYYIYPDGIAVRHFIIHGKNDDYSITEPAVLSNPGEKPENNIDLDAVTLANTQGLVRTYSNKTWPSDGSPGAEFTNPVPDAVLNMVNVRSTTKPFYIYEPGTTIIPYGGGIKEIDYGYSHFHARNHWPVAQIPCDGRFVLADDRVTSSALTSPEPPMKRRKSESALKGRFILGLTGKPLKDLIPLAKFWINTPGLVIKSEGFASHGFDRNERAFKITEEGAGGKTLNIEIDGSSNSPVFNPAFVVKNWGKGKLNLYSDGKELNDERDFRYALRRTLESTDLIVWMKISRNKKLNLTFKPE